MLRKMRCLAHFIGCFLLFHFALKGAEAGKRKYIPEVTRIKQDDKTAEFLGSESKVTMEVANDGTIILNGKLLLLVDLPGETMVTCTGYQQNMDKKSWQTLPSYTYKNTVCDIIMNDTYFVPDLIKGSNAVRECPLKKKLYELKNCEFGKNLPDDLPGDSWLYKLDFALPDKRTFVMEVVIFLEKRPRAPGSKPNGSKG